MFLVNSKFVPMFRDTRPDDAHRQMQEKLEETARGSSRVLNDRLCQLDRESDIGRGLAGITGVLVVAGTLGALWSPWWLLLSAFGGLSLVTLGLFGWSPVLPLLHSLGFRTAEQIAQERYALKVLRGDFQKIAYVQTQEEREAIANMEGEGGPPCDRDIPDAGDAHIVREALEAVKK